ncbi:MAG: hypothetical protein WC976_07035 [Caldisericia bacterium]
MEDLDLKKFMNLQIEVFQILLQEFTVSIQQIIETDTKPFRDDWEFGDTDVSQFLEFGRGLVKYPVDINYGA